MTPDVMMSNSTLKQSVVAEDDRCISGPLEWTLLIGGIILGVAIILFLIRKCVQGPFYRKKNRIDGKVVIITGCNTGIGKETALELARRGAKIYMACRDPVRCEGARLEIIEKTKNENIFNRTLDLGSLASVRKFAEKFTAEEPRLDILINNAGVMATPKGETKDGFDLQLGTNHLGHFLLTNLLLDTLKNSAPSRIVIVTSAIYAFGNIHKDDLNFEKTYSKWGAYAQSKLANILFALKLSEKLHGTDVTVNCCHPGLVKTELGRHIVTSRTKSILEPVTGLFFKSPKAGAQSSLRLALDPALDKSTGGYYLDTIRFPVLPKAKNKEVADWLWTVSEEMVGLRPMTQATSVPVTLQVPPSNGSNGHTTVIEVEKAPSQDDIPDNKKMEEGLIKANGNSEKKEISEKMNKIIEDEKGEKMDEPEKTDKSEKTEKSMEATSKQPEKTDDIPEKIDVQEKFEKINKDVDNSISKMTPDVITATEQMAENVFQKVTTPKQMKKQAQMEDTDAIESADAIEEREIKAEKTDIQEKQI